MPKFMFSGLERRSVVWCLVCLAVAVVFVDPVTAESSDCPIVPPSCSPGNARDNNENDPLKFDTYDFVPVVSDNSRGYYQVYSAKDDGTGLIDNNANISLFALPGDDVLMFGSGYGDHHTAAFDSATDACLINEVIEECLGLVMST